MLKKILGIISAIAGLFMIASAPYVINGASGINAELINSEIDKIFLLLLFLGCGICYNLVAVFLITNWKPTEHNFALKVGMISMLSFTAGLYYHFVFGSPW